MNKLPASQRKVYAMSRRNLALLATLVLVTTPLTGCLGDFSLPGGIGGDGDADPAARARAMLDAPPGADVKETGRVREFTLFLHEMPNHEMYPGASMPMWGFSLSEDPETATVPGPEIRVTEGDLVRVTFQSLVSGFEHTVHWHGQHVPWDMDGVPYVSQDPVQAGESFTYEFIAKPAGTYWYHCHVDVQHHLDMGMYGAFIVEPQDPDEDPPFDSEYTMILDEMDKYHLESGSPQGQNQPQSGDPFEWEEWARRQGQDTWNRNQVVQDRVGESDTVRPQRDWYPVTYAPYTVNYNTFLINGHAFPFTEPVMIKEGETLRIRLINVGNFVHTMHLHGHHWLVTHKDGVLLEDPYWADSVTIGPGERYDLYVVGNNPGVWDLHNHAGRTNQNDNIWPGGQMTMLVYEEFMNEVGDGGHGGHGRGYADLGYRESSGAWIRWYGNNLLP